MEDSGICWTGMAFNSNSGLIIFYSGLDVIYSELNGNYYKI